ncbi:hypothetical protein L1887_31934 [Cichorium endivia]|nr:hypothetical protein L1887_31934 [Cichorium endivia]
MAFSLFSPKLYKSAGVDGGTSVAMMHPTAAAAANKSNLGFKTLMKSFTVDIHRAEGRKLNMSLIAPFRIATSRLEGVENVAIRIELNNGCVGWGEAPILPFVTAEDQITALKKAGEACEFLKKSEAMSLGDVLREIGQLLPGHDFASVSCLRNPTSDGGKPGTLADKIH